MQVADKFRIYPTEDQIRLLSKFFGCVRKAFNLILDEDKQLYKEYVQNYYDKKVNSDELKPCLSEFDSIIELKNLKIWMNFLTSKKQMQIHYKDL